jgi:hypothetical protein
MIQVDEYVAQQFVADFECGASYQVLMSKYNLTQQEVEILVERFFPSTLSQEVTIIDWKSQTQEDVPRLKKPPLPLAEDPSGDFFRNRTPYGKKGVRSWFRKLVGR